MSFGHVLLIASVAIIVASIILTSEHNENNGSDRRDSKNKSKESGETSPSADFAALIEAIRDEGGRTRKEYNREYRGEHLINCITLGVLTLTLGALSLTCWEIIQQVREMQKVYPEIHNQAQAAIDQSNSVIASERARLFVLPTGWTHSGDKDRNPKIPYTINNVGRTTALVTEILAECAVMPRRIGPIPVYTEAKRGSAMSVVVGGGNIPGTDSGCVLDSPILDTDFDGLSKKTETILFWGYAEFQDVFGHRWRKRFGMYSFGDGRFFGIENAPAYNAEEELKQ